LDHRSEAAGKSGSGKLIKKKHPYRLAVPMCVIFGALVFFIGCEPQTRYKVLSIFFTGVPTPEEKEKMRQEALEKKKREEEKKIAEKAAKDAGIAAAQKGDMPAAPAPIFTHDRYASGHCDDCHIVKFNIPARSVDRSKTRFTAGGGMPGVLVAPKEMLCIRCHDSLSASKAAVMGLWLHTPAARGEWNLCHDPHQSEHPSMLLKKTDALCLTCHQGKDVAKIKGHEKIENCLECHNPHLGKNRSMLVKGYKEEKFKVKELPGIPSQQLPPNAGKKNGEVKE